MSSQKNKMSRVQRLTREIGKFVLPVIKDLTTRLPALKNVVLCSSDGLNICSVGVEGSAVGKMSSLSSSIFALGDSIVTETLPNNNLAEEKKEILMMIKDTQIMVSQVNYDKLGGLVLLVTVDETATGALLVTLRHIVNQLEKNLADFNPVIVHPKDS